MPAPAPSPTPVPATFSGLDAHKHVQALAVEVGSRPGGSPAALAAADYISGQFSAMGYKAAFGTYTMSLFQERSVRLLLTRPQTAEVGARALLYSGTGSTEGQLVYVGLGRPSDFPTGDLSGKMALIQRGEITFQAKVENAVAKKAAGVVIYNNRAGELSASLDRPAAVPVVSISQSDGQRLQEYIRQGTTTMSLNVDASVTTLEGKNVIGTRGTDPGRKKVVIGAHYDSVSAGPGANDNASGAATLLELAEATRNQNYAFDLVFVAFGDEEVGLIGSRKYVESLTPQERSQVVAMINLDMVGVGDRMEFGGDATLVGQAQQIARSLGYVAGEVALKAGQSSDHASFSNAGIRSVFFYRSNDPNYHTRLDTADRVAPANLEAAGKVALRLLDMLSRSTQR